MIENNNRIKSAVSLKNITFQYDQSILLENINIEINSGEVVGIVGANGAGKSTILKLITGLLSPVKGSISILETELSTKTIRKVRTKIGYTFQDPDNQLFMPTVFEDVAFSLRQEGLGEEDIQRQVEETLVEVGGLHLKDKASYKMSGGEKRVITLATALISKPEILILDEPSVGLDPKSRRDLIRLLDSRNETMIITTHDMDMALDLCDRIIVLYKGTVQADDTPMNVFSNKQLLCNNHLELPLRMQSCPVCSQHN